MKYESELNSSLSRGEQKELARINSIPANEISMEIMKGDFDVFGHAACNGYLAVMNRLVELLPNQTQHEFRTYLMRLEALRF